MREHRHTTTLEGLFNLISDTLRSSMRHSPEGATRSTSQYYTTTISDPLWMGTPSSNLERPEASNSCHPDLVAAPTHPICQDHASKVSLGQHRDHRLRGNDDAKLRAHGDPSAGRKGVGSVSSYSQNPFRKTDAE